MESLQRGLRMSLVAVAVIAGGCGSSRATVRFGSLSMGDRSLDYKPDIAWWTLPNKLTVVLTPDARANIVSVDVRYLVGAAEDPPGKTGLAHLVEHMMFELRAAQDAPTLEDRLAIAALGHNAYTSADATHYSEIGLAANLDELLAIEATRMLLGCHGLDHKTFERERAVVAQELAQRGQGGQLEMEGALQRELFGEAHAYAHNVGGTDLEKLTLDDVCAFVDAHYAPSRAIVVVGGRVDPVETRRRISTWFGPIARHARGARAEVPPPSWTGAASALQAEIDEPAVMVAFPAAAWGSPEALEDELVDRLLIQRLRKFARTERWVTGVESGHLGGKRAGARYFALQVADAKRLDDAVAQIYRAAAGLPAPDDDDLVVVLGAERQEELLDAFESIAGRGVSCADYLQFTAHHEFQLRDLRELHSIDVARLRSRAQRLTPGASRVVRLLPSHARAGGAGFRLGASAKIDLPVWRPEVDPAEAERPLALAAEPHADRISELRLPNGMRVLMVSDFTQPIVEARLVFPVGEAGGASSKRGLAQAAADLLKHNTTRGYSLGQSLILQAVMRLGAQLSTDVSESTTFQVRGFSLFADWHVWRLHWLLENGRYYEEDLTRLREHVARAATHRDPRRSWRRQLREALFGRDHPYARATDVAADLATVTADELGGFREAFYRAPGATLIIVGNFNASAMARTVIELFGAWPATPPPALAAVPPMHPAAGPTWIAHADPDAAQLRVTYAFAATSPRARSLGARAVVGEMVRARLEQVRTRLGASYGVEAGYSMSDAGDVIMVDGMVDASRAGDVLRQMQTDLDGLRTGDAALAADFVRARRAALAAALADPIRSSTAADHLEAAVTNHLSIDIGSTLPAAIAATTLSAARAVIAQDLQPGRMVVLLSGRPADTDAALAAAGVTDARHVTEQGTP